MFKRLAAWRHGRGFGVHSPLAYDLISNTLCDKPAYYGDVFIESLFDTPRSRRLARIVLRMVARFMPARVAVEGVDARFGAVVKMADPRVEITDRQPDLLISRTPDGVLEIHVHPTLTEAGTGPLVIDSLRDLRLVIRRQGLSAQKLNVRL